MSVVNNMNTTPVSERLHIAIFGRRNAGKSTLINALTNQDLAVVSAVPGTTTDPVHKTMELLPIGPVVIIDTAGFDDVGELGALRTEKTYDILRKTNIAVLVLSSAEGLSDAERRFIEQAQKRQLPLVAVMNKCDLAQPRPEDLEELERLHIPVVQASAEQKQGIEAVKQAIIDLKPAEDEGLSITSGLVKPGDIAVLVTPIDKAAPKGRLILPQQQTIRDLLDKDAIVMVTKENALRQTLASLQDKPAVVITDSQVFQSVAADTPEDIALTSFSILFARYKGELTQLIRGVKGMERLKAGDRVLIVEGCTHHCQADDIGKVKIPRWLTQAVDGEIHFEWCHGTQFPKDLSPYALIIHCGACMLNKQEMQYRLRYAEEMGIPMTNYGMFIAYVQGILPRALASFPEAATILAEQE